MSMLKNLIVLLIAAGACSAQTNGSAMPFVKPQFFDNGGRPAASYKVCFYSSGTTTPRLTYTTSALNVANANPVVLDSSGRASIFFSANSYKVTLLLPTSSTTDCVTGTMSAVWTQDNIANNADLLKAALAASGGAGLIGYQYPGGTTRTVQNRLQDYISVKDFGAKGDGSTDDTAAITLASNVACGVAPIELYFPNGTYIIAPTVAANAILPSCSGLHPNGPGILKIKGGSGSFYSIWGHSGATLSDFHLSGITVDMNSANNPVPNPGDVDTHPRIVLHTGSGGSNNTVDHVHVTDVRSEWALFIASTNSSVTNNLIDNVGGGTVQHDSSLIYTEHGSWGAVVTGNRIVASARNAKMAVTGIETHSNVVVSNNSIQDMVNFANITGIDSVPVTGVVVSGNSVTGAFECIMLWSNSGQGATGHGLAGADVGGNYCSLAQLSYAAEGGATTGIVLNAQATLPFADINVHDNVVVFELSSSASDPYDTASFGVGYWDAGGNGGCDGCSFPNNLVVNAPANAFRFSANGSNVSIQGNTAINPGSSLNPGLNSSSRAGLFLSGGDAPIAGLNVKGNNWSDTLATSRMAYGVELATVNTSGIVIDGDVVNCADTVCSSLVATIGPNTGTQLPLTHAIVNVPVAKALPVFALRAGSSIYSMQGSQLYTWDGFSYTGFIPHPGTPTVTSGCGSGATVGGTDRAGIVTVGSGTVTACTLTFALAFNAQPYGSFNKITNLSGGVLESYTPLAPTLTFTGTNLQGNIFEWSFPLAN